MNQQERQGHQFFGKGAFDAAWALIDRSDRSEDEDLEMFLAAAASRWHKGQLGGAERLSLGDWQLAHVAALLGIAPPALAFARRNLQRTEAEGWAGWRLASAHEGMARACAVAGDAEGRARHLAAAAAALETEPEEDERELIASQMATVPTV